MSAREIEREVEGRRRVGWIVNAAWCVDCWTEIAVATPPRPWRWEHEGTGTPVGCGTCEQWWYARFLDPGRGAALELARATTLPTAWTPLRRA